MIDVYIKYLMDQGVSAATARVYARIVERLGEEDPAEWLRSYMGRGLSRATVDVAISAIAHWVAFRQGIPYAAAKAQLPVGRGRQAVLRASLSDDILDAFEAAARDLPEPFRTIFLILPRTGLRNAEVTGLLRTDVQAEGGVKYLAVRGKGNKVRKVPLSPETVELLQRYRQTAGHDEVPWFFTLSDGRPVSGQTLRRYAVKLRQADPRLAHVVPHVLRHTYATRLIQEGVDIAMVSPLLGHKSLATTGRYLHPQLSDLASAVNRLDRHKKAKP